MSDKKELTINIDTSDSDLKYHIVGNTVPSVSFQLADASLYKYRIHGMEIKKQSETTEAGVKDLDLKQKCYDRVKSDTEADQAFKLSARHRGHIMLVEFYNKENLPKLCARHVLIVEPVALKVAGVFFIDSCNKEIGRGSVQYEADLRFTLRVEYNRPLLKGEKEPEINCKGYCTHAETGVYQQISELKVDNKTCTGKVICNEGLQESHAGADYVFSLGTGNPYGPPFMIEGTDKPAPSVQKIHLVSRGLSRPQITSVVWSSKEMIKFGENSPRRKDIARNEDGFLHIHTRGMYGKKVRVELFEKDSMPPDEYLLLGRMDDILIYDNVASIPVEMSGVHSKAKKLRWFEGNEYEIVARVTPLDTSIPAFTQDDESLIKLKKDDPEEEDKAAKSTVDGTMKFVIADVEEDEKEEEEKDKEKKEDMITYHIYAKGHKKEYKIEKHVPKVNKHPEKYKYVYHTADDKEHEICTRTWIEVPEMSTKKIEDELSDVPTGYDADKTYTYPSDTEIDALKAYYYYDEDGKLDYIVVESKKNKKGEYKRKNRKYTANKSLYKKILNILEGGGNTLSYNQGGVTISFKLDLTQTARTYCGVDQFAVLIGVMADTGLSYTSAGCTSKDATGYPSLTHVNGYSFDFSYQPANDQKLVDAMQEWAPDANINVGVRENCGPHITGDNLKRDKSRKDKKKTLHDTHLHWGPNKNPTIDPINVE